MYQNVIHWRLLPIPSRRRSVSSKKSFSIFSPVQPLISQNQFLFFVSLVDIICHEDNKQVWGTLCIALTEASVFEFLGTAKAKKHTLFAPTNEAFENSEYSLDQLLLDESALESLISIHLTPSVIPYDKLKCNKKTGMISFFDTFTLCIGEKLIQNGDGNELRNLPIIEDPWNIYATNGIIHSVNNLILPFGFTIENYFAEDFMGNFTYEIGDDDDYFIGNFTNDDYSEIIGNFTDEEIVDDDYSEIIGNFTNEETVGEEESEMITGRSNFTDTEVITASRNSTASGIVTESENSTASDIVTESENSTANEIVTESENSTASDIVTESENITMSDNVTVDDGNDEDSAENDVGDQSTEGTVEDGDITIGVIMNQPDYKLNRGRQCKVCDSDELCAVPRSATNLLFPGEGEVACVEVLSRQKSENGINLGPSMCGALQQRFQEYCMIGSGN